MQPKKKYGKRVRKRKRKAVNFLEFPGVDH